MMVIKKYILKNLLLMSLLMVLNTSVFSMVQEDKATQSSIQDKDISDFDSDSDNDDEENARQNTSFCKTIMRCGCVVLIAYLAAYHSHPIIQSAQSYYCSRDMVKREWGDGPVREKFKGLDHSNDVCQKTKVEGCCATDNDNTLVCCRTDNVKSCFLASINASHGPNMFEFNYKREFETFNSGSYIQRGKIPLLERQDQALHNEASGEEEEQEDDQKESGSNQEEDPIEIPDELWVYTLASPGAFEQDTADIIRACERKGLPERMKNGLLKELRKNYDLLIQAH